MKETGLFLEIWELSVFVVKDLLVFGAVFSLVCVGFLSLAFFLVFEGAAGPLLK